MTMEPAGEGIAPAKTLGKICPGQFPLQPAAAGRAWRSQGEPSSCFCRRVVENGSEQAWRRSGFFILAVV